MSEKKKVTKKVSKKKVATKKVEPKKDARESLSALAQLCTATEERKLDNIAYHLEGILYRFGQANYKVFGVTCVICRPSEVKEVKGFKEYNEYVREVKTLDDSKYYAISVQDVFGTVVEEEETDVL